MCYNEKLNLKKDMIETLEYIIAHKGFCAWDGKVQKRAQEYRCNTCPLIDSTCRLFPEKHSEEENFDKYIRALEYLALTLRKGI